MEGLGGWILTVTAAAMLTAAAEGLMPEGTVKKVGKLTGGLLLMLAVLRPLGGGEVWAERDFSDLLPEASLSRTTLEEVPLADLEGIIEEELAAYIVDKGEELGLTCSARVICRAGEGGVPVPEEAVVTGPLTTGQQEALAEIIAGDLGIPRQAQQYRREEGT